jgi:DNA-binding XRE family transcriptional regulator
LVVAPPNKQIITDRLWNFHGSAATVRAVPEDRAVQQRLGQAVKELRKQAKITQEELSERTGVHPTYISDIERGARNPSFAALVKLVNGLGIGVEDLGRAYDQRP